MDCIGDYAEDLFSEAGHLKWDRKNMGGADFLRLQMLRALDSFHNRIFAIEAMRRAAHETPAGAMADRTRSH
jgi:hypothetical protein